MWNRKKVSVVFSTYNEKETIRRFIEDLFATKVVDEVIAVDNNAVKGTKELIKKTKAKYFFEPKQGFGNGYQRALREARGDIIITSEPDGTYVARDILKLLAYSDEFDVVCGTRTTSILIGEGANMGFLMKWANWAFAKMIEIMFNTAQLTDVGCTYRLISRRAFEKMRNEGMDGGNVFQKDWMLHIIRRKIPFIEVPVNFLKRSGESHGAANTLKATKIAIQTLFLIMKHRFNIIKVRKKLKIG